MDYRDEELYERMELAIGRLSELHSDEKLFKNTFIKDYFDKVSDFLLLVYDVYLTKDNELTMEQRGLINRALYEDILEERYKVSYANPEYAYKKLGKYGRILSALYAEIRSAISYVYENRILNYVALMELFIEVYGMWDEEGSPSEKYIKEAIYYYMYDYADVLVTERLLDTLIPETGIAYDIIMNSDFSDVSYLYKYGEYIGDNEIKTAKYLNSLEEDKIIDMAKTFVGGFIKGFEAARIDIKAKKTVNIRYSIGQERMVKAAIQLFDKEGLKPVIFRYAVSRISRKLTSRVGYVGTPANKQYEYDHRMDETLFFNKAFTDRKLSVMADVYEKHKDDALYYAGPAVIETFGENPFKPVAKKEALKLSKQQQQLMIKYNTRNATLTNKYIPRDKYSFTIIAYPIPEIGDNFEEIYDEIVKVNTLDSDKYCKIQQAIIDALDEASYVHVVGTNGNKTDIKVMLHEIDATMETNFENCLADVNIPLGEVFTSPLLTGTKGVLNVSSVYLNDLKYTDLYLTFEDGKVSDYTCKNFDDEEQNKSFVKENLMAGHDFLPIGEFAIGTNTYAYAVAKRFDILYKLPILIVEKMGPHFAVGDTCYSYSEENRLYNPDGREIVAKDNECSLLRKSEDEQKQAQAYFNCHTDITIPYEEIGEISAVTKTGERIEIIRDGRFVLSGTEALNEALDNIS